MSSRVSGYHQKGTQELSEIRVQDVGHSSVGLLSSLREKL